MSKKKQGKKKRTFTARLSHVPVRAVVRWIYLTCGCVVRHHYINLTGLSIGLRKGELKIRLMNEGRCDERLKARVEESTWLTYTGLHDWHPSRHGKPKPSTGHHRPLPYSKNTLHWGSGHWHGTVPRPTFLKLKQKSESQQRKPRPYVPTQILMRRPPQPNHTSTHHTNALGERATQRRW